MSKDIAAMFGLELPARALCAVGEPEPIMPIPASSADNNTSTAASSSSSSNNTAKEPVDYIHRFAVATASPRGNNCISLIEYIEGKKVAECAAVWNHQQEVHGISVSPLRTDLEENKKAYIVATIHPAAAASASSSQGIGGGISSSSSSSSKDVVPMGQVKRELSLFALPDSDEGGLHELRPIGTLSIDPVAVLWPVVGKSLSSAFASPATSTANAFGNAEEDDDAWSLLVVCRDGSLVFLQLLDGFSSATVKQKCILPASVLRNSVGASSTINQCGSVVVGSRSGGSLPFVTAACLDKRGTACFIASSTGKVIRVDLAVAAQESSRSSTGTIGDEELHNVVTVVTASAHAGYVRRIVNAEGKNTRLSCIVTSGDDGFIRGWDTKASANLASSGAATPCAGGGELDGAPSSSSSAAAAAAAATPTGRMTFEFLAHHHFAHCVAVNEHQPDLAVSCGADRCTRLWRVGALTQSSSSSFSSSSSSSAPLSAVHCLRVSEHRETVASVSWSGPWVWAACSFDGCVSIDQVPFEMRSQLLLSQAQ